MKHPAICIGGDHRLAQQATSLSEQIKLKYPIIDVQVINSFKTGKTIVETVAVSDIVVFLMPLQNDMISSLTWYELGIVTSIPEYRRKATWMDSGKRPTIHMLNRPMGISSMTIYNHEDETSLVNALCKDIDSRIGNKHMSCGFGVSPVVVSNFQSLEEPFNGLASVSIEDDDGDYT